LLFSIEWVILYKEKIIEERRHGYY